jgi:predicted regulator of Ras-like GTPase activity (Roadblock/LC7/MglB family)
MDMVTTDELDERIGKCKKILAKDPESLIFAALSEAYRRKRDLNMATKICTQGLKIHPDYGSAHLVMAKIHMDKRLFAEAEKELFLAIEADGRTRANELLLSEILMKKGKSKEAKALLDKLFATDPENPQVKKLLEEIKSKEEKVETEVKWKDIPTNYEILGQLKEKLSPTEALDEILRVPGVLGCLIVDREGLATESKFKKKNLNSEILGVASAVIFGEIEKNLLKVDFGSLDQTLIESKELNFWVLKFKNFLLGVCCDDKANSGFLKMRLSKLRSRISIE